MDSWLYDPDAYRPRRDVETYGPNLLPCDGVAVVAGASNTGKSTWLLAMMHYWDLPTLRDYDDDLLAITGLSPPFWYFAFEDASNMRNAWDGFKASYTVDLGDPHDRFRCLQDGVYGVPDKHRMALFAPPAGSLDLTDGKSVEAFCDSVLEMAKDQLEQWGQPAILIIDNMSLCIGDADENESLTARKVVRGLEQIREHFKGTALVILVHHTARDSNRLRGSDVLFNLVQGVVILSGTGDTVTAHCTKMKGAERDAKRKYRRTPMQGPKASYVDYVDITDTAAKPAKAAPAPTASPVPAEALQAPVAPATGPAAPAPKHPAEGLRGLPLEVWQLLALGTGESIAADAAKVQALTLPTFQGIEPRRRNDRWCDVLKTFTNKGLHDTETGLILNR